MKSLLQIINALDKELIKENKRFLTLSQANKILYIKGLISKDEKSNQALKKLLVENKIPNASQTKEKPRQWRIFLSDKGEKQKITYNKNKEKEIKEFSTYCPYCGINLTISKSVNKHQWIKCLNCNNQFENPHFQGLSSFENNYKKQIKIASSNEFKIPKDFKKWLIFIFMIFVVYTIATNDTNNSEVRNSPWDNSVHQVERYLKRTLKDPDSFEVIQWSNVQDMTHNQYGYRYKVMVKYRAKNSFGGYVIESDLFFLDENGRIVKVE